MLRKPPIDLAESMTADEVAVYCDVSRALVFQWRHRGRLSAVKVGRAILFAKPEVQKFRRELRKAAKVSQVAAQKAVASSTLLNRPKAPK